MFENKINHRFIFKWHTPLACPIKRQNKNGETLEDKFDPIKYCGYNNTVGIYPQMETLSEVNFILLFLIKNINLH